jgi:ATP-binding cassette subfamily C (CFTR/MRP) protein 1
MAVSAPPTIIALYFIQIFYLRTSRQIRCLDLEAKSPLYQHYTETLEGLATIRALRWGPSFDKVAMSLLDDSHRPFYLLYSLQRWLKFGIGFCCCSCGYCLGSNCSMRPQFIK